MIAADTSSLVEFLRGSVGHDVFLVEVALDENNLILPPVVLTEIISDPNLSSEIKNLLKNIPSFPLKENFWERAGILRSRVLAKKRKARLGDALIAQFCIDHNLTLITRDKDFEAFTSLGHLKILT